MKGQKRSRQDVVEKTLDKIIEIVGQQDQAIRWLVQEHKKNQPTEEVEDPNQTKLEL